MVIRMELLLEVYQACLCTAAEEVLPDPEELRQILYWLCERLLRAGEL